MSWMPFIKLFSPGPSGSMPMLTPEKLWCYSEATQHLISGVHRLFYCNLPHDIFHLGRLNNFFFALHRHSAVADNGIQAVAVTRRVNQ